MASLTSPNDPIRSFSFIVDIEGLRAGFSEVSGLGAGIGIVEYREGSENVGVRQFPGQVKYTVITLKRGFTQDAGFLLAWRKSAIDGRPRKLGGTITLLDEARNPVFAWQFSGGLPSKLAGPSFNASEHGVAIETLEIFVEGRVLLSSRGPTLRE